MRTNRIALLVSGIVAFTGVQAQQQTQPAATEEDNGRAFGVTIGVRAFINSVSGLGYSRLGGPGIAPAVSHVSTGNETSFLPSLSLSYGRYVFSANYHASTDYDAFVPEASIVDPASGGNIRFERKEWDASFGYALFPNLVVSVGWKELKISPDSPLAFPQEYSGPFVGVAGSAPLAGGWSIYGSFAYGRVDLEVGGVEVGDSGNYLSSEIGFRYPLGQLSPRLERASFLIGYRSQSVRVKDVPSSFVVPGTGGLQNAARRTRDGIDGVTLGVTYSF